MSNNPYTQPHQPPMPGPNEAPPSYSQSSSSGTGPASTEGGGGGDRHQDSSHLTVPSSSSGAGGHAHDDYTSDEDNGHPDEAIDSKRRSMETELMELPKGWRREFDATTQHVFYVDTTKDPPRSIWVHPFEPEYLASLPDSEHDRLHPERGETTGSNSHASSSTGDHGSSVKKEEKRTLGRKMKDKLTNSTHDERVAERKRQEEQQRKLYAEHMKRRQAMLEASRNGTYQPMYAAPSYGYPGTTVGYGPYGGGYSSRGYYGGGGYGGYGGYGGRGYYGGGGMGAGMGAGLLGGVLLGGLLF